MDALKLCSSISALNIPARLTDPPTAVNVHDAMLLSF